MGCDHPSCVPVGPLAGELWHFDYFPTTTVKSLITWLSLLSEFAVVYQISSKLVHAFCLQSPDANNCGMFSAPLLGNGRCHGNRIMANTSETWWDVTTQVVGWHFEYFPTWRPSAILNFKNFNIWSRDCHCGSNLLLRTKFHQNWFTRSTSRRP